MRNRSREFGFAASPIERIVIDRAGQHKLSDRRRSCAAVDSSNFQRMFLVAWLLTSIFERKQEARNPYLRLVEVNEETTDPAAWGVNWAREYDDYLRTAESTKTRFGGSETLPDEKAKANPWLTRMFAGYAFAIDYRDRRGHAYMNERRKEQFVVLRVPSVECQHRVAEWNSPLIDHDGLGVDPGREIVRRQQSLQLVSRSRLFRRSMLESDVKAGLPERVLIHGQRDHAAHQSSSQIDHLVTRGLSR